MNWYKLLRCVNTIELLFSRTLCVSSTLSLMQEMVTVSFKVNKIDTTNLKFSCVGVSSSRCSETPSISTDFSLFGVKVWDSSPEMSRVSLLESVAVQAPEIASPQ